MGDPIATGFHTTGFLVNKVFDRIPTSVFAGDTYRNILPKAILPPKSKSRERKSRERSDSENNADRQEAREYLESMDDPRRRQWTPDSYEDARSDYHRSFDRSANNFSPTYSQQPPHLRPEYTPRGADHYYPPPPPLGSRYGGSDVSSRRVRDDEDAYYNNSVAKRPPGAARRTSSFNGRDMVKHDRKKEKAAAEEEQKEEHHLREDFLTKSPQGLAAGGLGALVGGFLAEKAQVKAGREGERSSGALFLTGLGAVVGGLAANAAVDHYQHKKESHARQDARWDSKWGEAQPKEERQAEQRQQGRLAETRDRDARNRINGRRDSDEYASARSSERSEGGSRRSRRDYGDARSVDDDGRHSNERRHRSGPHLERYEREQQVYYGEPNARESQTFQGERDGRGYVPYA